MSHRALNPKQLAMFMTAGELKNDLGTREHLVFNWTPERLWDAKRADNEHSGIDVSDGVREPVMVRHDPDPYLLNGHHRVVAAYDRNPAALVPVEHY